MLFSAYKNGVLSKRWAVPNDRMSELKPIVGKSWNPINWNPLKWVVDLKASLSKTIAGFKHVASSVKNWMQHVLSTFDAWASNECEKINLEVEIELGGDDAAEYESDTATQEYVNSVDEASNTNSTMAEKVYYTHVKTHERLTHPTTKAIVWYQHIKAILESEDY